MTIFKPIKIRDPKTGEERILTPEEQEELLEKGVIIDVPAVTEKTKPEDDNGEV